tara:strand:- start:10273 stop:11304 length:1032 start_codon:yes stop_codon:yes gene_type:complete
MGEAVLEEAKITFYRIAKCGYYRPRGDQYMFGSLADLLEDLAVWSQHKDLGETLTFTPGEDGPDLGVYLLSTHQLQGDRLVALWNATPETDGKVASVSAISQVGNPEVFMNAIQPNSIPGYSTYFWFIHGAPYFASIRFQHLSGGHYQLQTYLQSFLRNFGRHVVFDEDAQDPTILGYCERPGADILNLRGRFRSELFTKAGEHELLIRRATSIRKIIRKSTLSLERRDQRAMWQRLLEYSGMREPIARRTDVKLGYELEVSLTETDVRELIAQWQDEQNQTEWDDLGFVFTGDANKVHWISRSIARDTFELDVRRENPEHVNGESLLHELHRLRRQILATIP